MKPVDTRKDEIEGMFAGMESAATQSKKLICCWPPPGSAFSAEEILAGRHAMAKAVLQSFEAAVTELPQP